MNDYDDYDDYDYNDYDYNDHDYNDHDDMMMSKTTANKNTMLPLDVLQVLQEMINIVLPIIKTLGPCGNNQKRP